MKQYMQSTILVVVALLYAPQALGMEPQPGEVACHEDGETCYITWNLSESARDNYRVERFEPETETWHSEQESRSPNAVTDNPAIPGHLYRVLGCNLDDSGFQDCVSTSVYWAPVIPDSADEIPERMFDSDGRQLHISKRTALRTQILTYNVYLFVQAFGKVDMKALPLMTEPPTELDNLSDLSDIIHYNVYPNYVGFQESAFGIHRDPGPERADAGPLHPVDHPDHDADHEPDEEPDKDG